MKRTLIIGLCVLAIFGMIFMPKGQTASADMGYPPPLPSTPGYPPPLPPTPTPTISPQTIEWCLQMYVESPEKFRLVCPPIELLITATPLPPVISAISTSDEDSQTMTGQNQTPIKSVSSTVQKSTRKVKGGG